MELNLCWNGQVFREGTQALKQELAGDSFFIRFIHFTLFYK